MNQHAYKLVFNQKRGMLVAVSEVAVNHSKEPNSGQTQGSSGHTSGTAQRIKHGMVMLLMAFQIWQPLLAAPVAITPDNTQAGSKPTVSAANNGVPVVNIISPNNQGVSINQFKEYNVPTVGLILNNSGGTSQTQLGGYIQGNPMLGNRAASTIVNQVNGPNKSLILGAQEIAGQRANLILANQNGVSINGGSFINTANVTLTTGAPQYNNGALAGYAVKDGLIDVGAGGLDASTTDKLTILTRAAQINGQIWAKQAELITGQNQISFDAQGKHRATANPSGANTTPSYALDVSAVGGMYAGQMRIIGTEQGLGVNNAGQLVSAGELSLDAQGNLTNSGHIDGGGNTDIRVVSTDNSGQISAVNNLTFNNQRQINNSGTITAGSVQIDASSLVNTGTLNQTGVQGMDITAQNLNNTGTVGIVADATAPTIDPSTGQPHINNSTAPATSTGETNNSAGQITTNPVVLNDGHIHVTQDLTNQGKLLTAGALTVNVVDTLSNTGAIRTADALNLKAQQIDNQTAATIASQTSATLNATQLNNQGKLQAQTLTATANNIDNSQGSITGEQSLTLNADGSIKNAQGNIQSEQLTLNTPNLNNAQGTINAGAGDLSLANANLNNQQGAVYANNLTLTNQSINNQGGQLIARQALKAGNATTTQIDNTAGLIASQNSTTQVQANRILNDQGLIQGTDTQVIANTLSNTDSGDYGILGTQAVTVKADSIDNSSGRIAGHSVTLSGNSTPASNSLINTAGHISADTTLNVNAQTLSNTKGVISADTASLTVQQLDNSQGQIYAQTQLSTDSDSLTNTAGQLLSNGSANVNATNINNTDNGLIQAQNLTVTAETIDNSRNKPTANNIGGGIIGVDSLTLDAQTLTNNTGYVAGGTLNLNNNTPTATIDNTHGLIATNSDLTFNQAELNNQQGGISAKNLTLNNTTINNQGGQLLASENLTASAETLNNQGGTVAASQTASITGTTVNNQAGLIQGHKTTIDAASLDNSNTLDAGGIIAEQALSIQLTQTLNNDSGNIAGDSVEANVANIDNSQGAIQANGALKLTATKHLNNSAGTIASAGAVNLSGATLTNAQKGYIASKTQVGIQAGSINNQTGAIVSDQTVKLSGDTLNNQQGQIQGKDLTLNVTNIDNSNTATTGGLTGTASLNLTATSLINHAGYVAGQQAILNSDTIDNSQKGVMVGVDSLNITGQTLNNQTGQISATGDIDIQEGRVDNSAGLISTQANLTMGSGSTATQLTNSAGQILAGQSADIHATDVLNDAGLIRAKDLTVNAGSITNTHSGTTGGMVGDSQLSLNTQGALNNTAGYIAGDTAQIHSATLDNTTGTITGLNQLSIETGKLTNAQGNIASNAQAVVTSTELANTQGHIGASTLTVNTGTLDNTQGEVIGSTTANLTATDIHNTAGWLQGKALTINTNTLDNGLAGIVLGNQTLDITANSSINNAGTIQSGDEAQKGTAHLSTATLGNTGSIHADSLTLDGTDLNNNAGKLTATENLTVNAGTLSNQAGLVSANGTVQLNVGALDNSQTHSQTLNPNNTALGIQADTVNIVGQSIHNDTGRIVGNTVTTQGDSLNNSHGLVSGNTVKVTAPSLTNTAGTLTADDLTLTTHNTTNQGTIQGNNSTTLKLSGDFSNQGVLSSAGSLVIHTDGNITNTTGSTLSANNTLDLAGQNITNQTNATMSASHTLLNATDTITNDGTIDGNLTELRAGNQIINNHKIYGGDFEGNGGIVIGTGNLINNANAVIASRADMAIGAVSITNEVGGLIQSQGDMTIGRTLGSAADGYVITGMADRLDNKSATIEVGGNITKWDVAQTNNINTQFATQTGGDVASKPYSYYVVDGQQLDTNGNYHFNALNTLWYKDGFTGFHDGDGKTMHEAYMSNLNLYHYDPRYVASEGGGAGGTQYHLILNPMYTFSEYSPLDLRKWNPYVGGFYNKLRSWDKFIVGVDYIISNKDGTQSSASINEVREKYGFPPILGLSSLLDIEYINLAYYPEGKHSFTYETYCNATEGGGAGGSDCYYDTYSEYFLDTFTYQKDDAIWSKFGVIAPTSNAPEYPNIVDSIIAPDKYNAQLSAYRSWADQNRDTYITLNRKIVAFNRDWNDRAHFDFDAFEGTATTTAPVITRSAPAKILVSGDMNLAGHITNDKSQIVIGGSLLGNVTGIDNDNTGATAQKVTSYSGILQEVRNGWIVNSIAANPAPTIETVNLSIADTKINVGAQAVANAAGNNSLGVNAVNLVTQTTTSNNNQTSKDLNTSNLNGSNTATGGNLNAQGSANTSDPLAGNTNPATGTDIQSQEHNPTNSPVSAVATGNGQEIRTVAFNGILPSNVLFNVANDPNANYIVETDPQYTNKKQFLSSNYLLEQYDPTHTFKRIGDGYYEQKLITDQIITATGKRYVGDYSSNEVQYKALMDSGLAIGKAFNLSVGAALTAEQMSQLTTDIIWMVEETVTLADGTKVKALVPKVYLATNALDLKGDGTLIASKNNFLNVTGDVNNNGGTIAAFKTMNLAANTINNKGGTIGGNKGSDIVLRTQGDLNNIGGSLRGGNLALDVGGNLNSITTTYHTQTGDMNLKDRRNYASVRDGIDQVASIQALDGNHSLKDAQGNTHNQTALNIQVGGDANFKASNVSSAGDAYTSAQNINLTTVDTGFAENAVYNWSKKNKHRTERSDTAEVGSAIVATGDNTVVADDAVNIRAGSLISDQALTVVGDRINVDAGRATHADYSETYTKKKGFLSSRTSHSISQNHADTTVGSQLVGDTVTTLSTGDTTIKGSTVFGTNGVDMISTDGNINLQASEDRFNNHNYRKDTKSGFGALGGLSFGKMSNEQGRTGDQIGHTGSTVASLNGDVNLSARQGSINVQASDINSQNANVDLQAQQINLTDVHNTATVDQYTKYKSAGLSVSASVAGINAVQSTAQAADLLGQAANGSQSIAAGASSALAAYGAYREVKGLVNGISGLASAKSATDVAGALGASVSVSLGVQKSESKSHSEQSTSAGSSVTAGSTVNLTATGKGADSDINLTHATVAGAQGTRLKAEGDILAQAGVNTARIDSSNKSNGASIGVGFGGNGFTLNLSANGGKGVANGDETTYSETTIGNANSNTTLSSGADTTLDGAIVQGKRVKADVGGKLTINTPQDVSHYDSKQTSYGVGVSIPLGAGAFGVSGSYSNDKVNANTNTTQEIAGIYAGEGGYDIQVKGNTTLDAGVIASTATPDKNQFTTSTLVLKDKANQSAYDANSVGLSASYSGKQTTTDANGNTVPKMITNDKGEQVQAQGGTVKGFGANLPSTMSASDDASSTTRAAISNGSITITNDAAQQQLTGQTAEQTISSINHDTANNATLTNLYEQDKESIQTGFAISKGLSQNFATFMNDMAKDMDSVAKSPAVGKDGKPIIKDGKQLTNQEAYQAGLELGDTVNKAGDTINYGTRQDLWGSGGTGNRIATALIGAYSGNVSNGASTLLQNTALNVVRTYGATEIKHLADGFSTQTDDKGNPIPNGTSETVRGLLHAIAGCAGASATGGDCASAGLASAGTVAMNNAMTALLNLNPNDMTDTQKQAYSNLIGTLVAGVSTAVGGDAAAAQLASRVEVENNFLIKEQANLFKTLYLACKTDTCKDDIFKQMKAASDVNIANVEFYITQGDAKTVKALEEQAASSMDVSFLDDPEQRKIMQNRENRIVTLESITANPSLTDQQHASIVSDFRNANCSGMSASSCDDMVNEWRADNFKNAMSLVGQALAGGVKIPTVPRIVSPVAANVLTNATQSAVKGEDYKVSNLVYDSTIGAVVDKYTGKMVAMVGYDQVGKIVVGGNVYLIQKATESSVVNPTSHYLGQYDLVLVPGYKK